MERKRAFGAMKSVRLWGLWVLPLLVIAWLFGTDPDGGLSTRDMLQGLAVGVIAVTLAHVGRKFVLDYIKLEELVRLAKAGNTAAAIVVLGVLIFMSSLLFVFAPRAHAQNVQTYVPAGAYIYAPILKVEQVRLWVNHPAPAMLGALVEQESCISLKHSRCWNPGARLKTDREEGAGFGQITRAYRDDRSLRFDALDAARQLDPSLREWSWSNVYKRPDLQLRAIVAMSRDCDRRLRAMVADPQDRLQLCDAAYNGGWGGMQQERRACGQRAGCDPQRWFANTELVCLKSKVRWKGYGKSACEINREHVYMVAVVRRPKYVPLLEAT
jgi:hypothetical protein